MQLGMSICRFILGRVGSLEFGVRRIAGSGETCATQLVYGYSDLTPSKPHTINL